jgi:hypothetical protein
LFAEHGWISWLPPESLSGSTLANALLDQLDGGASATAVDGLDMSGRSAAVQHLLFPSPSPSDAAAGNDDPPMTGEEATPA